MIPRLLDLSLIRSWAASLLNKEPASPSLPPRLLHAVLQKNLKKILFTECGAGVVTGSGGLHLLPKIV